MTQIQTPQAGSFCWCDLATSDPNKAFAFYSGLLGWQKLES